MGPLMPALFSGWYFHVCAAGRTKNWVVYVLRDLAANAPAFQHVPKLCPNPICLKRPGLLFERKQIPQIVVIVRIQRRKAMDPLGATKLPWAQPDGFQSFF